MFPPETDYWGCGPLSPPLQPTSRNPGSRCPSFPHGNGPAAGTYSRRQPDRQAGLICLRAHSTKNNVPGPCLGPCGKSIGLPIPQNSPKQLRGAGKTKFDHLDKTKDLPAFPTGKRSRASVLMGRLEVDSGTGVATTICPPKAQTMGRKG